MTSVKSSTSETMGYTLPSSSDQSPRDQARALMEKKQHIEAELEAQFSILKANGCDMDTPLVDRDGFPRADIEIWAVRSARVRIIELRNDLNAVMSAIAKALEGVFDPSLAVAARAEEELKPFAKVNSVSPGSPASQAVSCPCSTFDTHVLRNHIIRGSNQTILSSSLGT
jgi:26S proteasome non-ATPase regulatory subunit 9